MASVQKTYSPKQVTREWLAEHRLERRLTLQTIGDMLGVTRESVRQYLNDAGIGKPDKIDYVANHGGEFDDCHADIFDVIDTEEKAYWLGVLAARVRIHESRTGLKSISIDANPENREFLECLLHFIGMEKFESVPLYDSQASERYRCKVRSHRLSESLEHHKISPQRHLYNEMSPYVPAELIRHYLRGYYEFKGLLLKHQTGSTSKNRMFMLRASVPFLQQFQHHTTEVLGIQYGERAIRGPGESRFHILAFQKRDAVRDLALYFYDRATIYYEPRKQQYDEYFGGGES